jgi:hypothetical protein
MKLRTIPLVICGLVFGAYASSAMAYDLPPLNLGFTSFLDAAPPAGNGWYFTQYVQHYTSNNLKDNNGKDLALPPGANPDLDVTVSLTQGIYISEQQLFGGNIGIDVILPTVATNLSGIPSGVPLQDNSAGFGDLLVGPFIQWPPIMGENGPKFFQRVELQVLIPTGEYDSNREINPGSNFWSFNPYWSGTYFFSPNLTGSVRAHYLWNGKNDDPNRGFGPNARDTRAGQAFHTNFALEYAVTPQLRLGFNGYYLKQTTDTELNGTDLRGRREKVLGLGLGGMYSFSKDDHIFINLFDESQAENRPEGQRYGARWVHHF